MRILLIGDADSVWIKEYCANVLVPAGYSIVISTHNNDRFADYYKKNGIRVLLQRWETEHSGRISRVTWLIEEMIRLKTEQYDYVHVQYGSRYNLRLAFILHRAYIVTFWGSDLLRSSNMQRKEMALYLKRADKIVVLTDKMRNSFYESGLRNYLDRIRVFDFGISNLECIRKITEENRVSESRAFFRIPNDKIVITIGYNKSEAQQYNEVLRELRTIPGNIKGRLFFLFHMSYGKCSETYYSEFIRLINGIGCDYKIVTNFLTDDGLAYIRLAADIFINAQTTDSLAATVNEYLYAGKTVFSPNWLIYKELDNICIDYIRYNTFKELTDLIIRYCEGKIVPVDVQNNRQMIWENYSWDARRKDWLNLYIE